MAFTEPYELRAFKAYIDRREKQRLVQFFMALRDDFEGLRGTILHCVPLPIVDSIVNELLTEEIRLMSHSRSHHERGNPLPSPFVFVAPFNKGKPQGIVGFTIREKDWDKP
ncbi:hypothetical protein KIW84_045951 [Lathyrus oleraceus]|uniref:Uncharacterized protein n=1 Tax=Pisum sativum TaxID=3888 RepID=A0A9D4XPK5_PEA|nr:hypothetical protein KIW84_045951 [Pisum sativum]